MKSILFSILLITLSTTVYAQSDAILGTWLNEEGDAKIEIYKSSGKYYGKIIWLKDSKKPDGSPKTDMNNPNPNLRNRQIIGLVIIQNLEFKNGKWQGGTIYSPEKGQTVSCELQRSGNTLKIKASKGFMSATKKWSKV